MTTNALSPLQWYQQQLEQANTALHRLLQRKSRLGWIRLFCLLVPVALLYILIPGHATAVIFVVIAGISVFLYVVSQDMNNSRRIEYTQRDIALLQSELSVLNHEYSHLDDGKRFEPAVHPYAGDIDVFGAHSLYQYINRCESEQGKQLLAHHFLQPLPAEQVIANQEAVRELAQQPDWRLALQNYGKSAQISLVTQQRVQQWLNTSDMLFKRKTWKYIIQLYPLVPFACVGLYLAGQLSFTLLTYCLFILFIISSAYTKKINGIYSYISRIVPEISVLQLQLQHVEQPAWKAGALKDIQSSSKVSGQPASGALLDLKHILNRFDFRLNVMVMPFLNTFLLWDIRQAHALQQWRQKNEATVMDWFGTIARIEVLHTLATLHFNQPAWSFPTLSDRYFTFEAEEAGHPLIPAEKRVNNSCAIDGTGQIMLITGSNMAGKSTFLRSLGVNTVLSMMGAPVCASKLSLSPVHLISSMRIADNLAENTSTFYAELKKLQQIITEVNQHARVFILLDEILRGTNSLDRHTGSKALIEQLIKENAIAVVATHDIALSNLQQTHPTSLHNYHFDVQVAGEDDLYFDYKLKRGVCQSMNASILMKKIGINITT
ncbi:MutS-related protein [Filimonas effusa]|uniref:DNA mismatch repair proteins mutS family domain-containing protein n=1 Tax=Filimonas effusa TaxID=2508721 RepID=A0A4Q1DEH9_9BACT|nr:hypothetical protein [Filimonas effusa]RXK87093.1 hypothetical protein ESB13_09995 [Filimonas effusa]